MGRKQVSSVIFAALLCAGWAASARAMVCNVPEPGNCYYEGVIVDCSLCRDTQQTETADPTERQNGIDQTHTQFGPAASGFQQTRFCNALPNGTAFRRNTGSACVTAGPGCSAGGCVAVADHGNCRGLLTAFCSGPATAAGPGGLDPLAEKIAKENASRASRTAELSTGDQASSRKEASTIKIQAANASATLGALYCAEGANVAVEKGAPAERELARCREFLHAAKGLAGNAIGVDAALLRDPAATDVLNRFESKFAVPGEAYVRSFLGARGSLDSLARITQGEAGPAGSVAAADPVPARAPASRAGPSYADQMRAAAAAARGAGIQGLDRFTVSAVPVAQPEQPGAPVAFSLEGGPDDEPADYRAMRGLMRAALDRRGNPLDIGHPDDSLFRRVSARYRFFREDLRKR